MPAFNDSTVNFLHGLSDLWIRFFTDREQLKQIYNANGILLGQTYFDLLENVLNLSVRESPVYGKDFFRLLTIREDLVTDRLDGRWEFDLTPSGIKQFEFLQNKILDPTTVLEYDLDFTIDLSGEQDLLLFNRSPFDWNNDGTDVVIPGVAYRLVEVTQDDGSTELKRELAFWIPDCKKDNFNLYLNFGYLIQRFEPSSEAYRALIQGVIRYFTLGPTPGILVSALNVICGVPVIRDDGEYLLRVDTDVVNGVEVNTVVTSARSYEFDAKIPLRDDILDPANWADHVGEASALSFHAFEHFTELFQIYDSLNNWTWWYDKIIPLALLPDEPEARRTVDPSLYENKVNYPDGMLKIGDPGLYIGADDDYDPENPFIPTSRPSLRHSFAYLVFERFMRHHTFLMKINRGDLDPGDPMLERLDEDLQNIVLAGKSAYTFLFTEQE